MYIGAAAVEDKMEVLQETKNRLNILWCIWEKNLKKSRRIYVCQIHFALHQKLTKRKSTPT